MFRVAAQDTEESTAEGEQSTHGTKSNSNSKRNISSN